jgi:proteasome assembly chaperone (PAC2) family protein
MIETGSDASRPGTVERVPNLVWTDKPALRRPVMVAAFKGWNDAGESASAAVGFLLEQFDGEQIAVIDPEEFYDFTAVRPTVSLRDGESRTIEWPENSLHAARIPGADRDLVILQGIEPSLRWKTFCGLILEAGRELGVEMVVTLGALLADVPHTRPVPITGLASSGDIGRRIGYERSTYEGPTGIVGVLHHICSQEGIPSASLWASVPHYVAAAPNPKAALSLIRSFEGLTHIAVDATALEESSEDYERQVNAAVATDPDVKAFVERLEQTLDEQQEDIEPDRLPSADSIARDFQRFLRQRGPDGPGSAGGA